MRNERKCLGLACWGSALLVTAAFTPAAVGLAMFQDLAALTPLSQDETRPAPVWPDARSQWRAERLRDCPCNADLDGNGWVDLDDFSTFAVCVFNPAVFDCAGADFNCDGDIDGFFDYAVFECQFGGPPDPTCCLTSCCLPDDTCQELSEEDCLLAGGELVTGGCDFGGCCLDENTCAIVSEDDCLNQGGEFLGPCLRCTDQNAFPFYEGDGEVFIHHVGPPVVCPPPDGKAIPSRDCEQEPFIDAWISTYEVMCHNFGVSGSPAIPADFFEPGSEPFSGQVCLAGVPLGIPEFGDADTLIERWEDPFDRCDLPGGPAQTVDIEIVALSLVSVAPITVVVSGQDTFWDTTVDLSVVAAPSGTLTAEKTHCNGGTYTSVLYVQPRFTFTKVSKARLERVLDTGLAGIDYVTLDQSAPSQAQEWVSDVDPDIGATVDPCTDFHTGIEQYNPHGPLQTECDCQPNGIRDICDIEEGTSQDVNFNRYPDECEGADTDGDNVPDGIDNCPLVPNPGQEDIDLDGVGDVCDNCPDDPNPEQGDCNGDGDGDVCDPDPGEDDGDMDGVCDYADICPCTPEFVEYVDEEGRPIGDFDMDCDVDLSDFATFALNYGATDCP